MNDDEVWRLHVSPYGALKLIFHLYDVMFQLGHIYC